LKEVGSNKDNFILKEYERSVILSRRKSVRREKTGPSKNTGVTNARLIVQKGRAMLHFTTVVQFSVN
jgi:hypothetical protein